MIGHGECTVVADYLLKTALEFISNRCSDKPICLLFGGEPTIKIRGEGVGGRNQHLALLFASLIDGNNKITFLSAGTDGSDGPTMAAGAIVDYQTIKAALLKNIEFCKFLEEFDSYHFFEKAGGHVITGHTGTNVMDIMILLIE